MMWIHPEYQRLFKDHSEFDDFFQIQGDEYRRGVGRVTLRFELQGQGFFIKRHSGIGWREIFKNLSQGKLPVPSAVNEWKALKHLRMLDISTLEPVACGKRGLNPATQHSFLVTRALQETTSLEDVVVDWRKRSDYFLIKRCLIRQVAIMARRCHRNGLNHRDMYICHIHVKNKWLRNPSGDPELFLIDLHRAQIRSAVPLRWKVKDIASLYFSAMGGGITRQDLLRFAHIYFDGDVREACQRHLHFWKMVDERVRQLHQKWQNSRNSGSQSG